MNTNKYFLVIITLVPFILLPIACKTCSAIEFNHRVDQWLKQYPEIQTNDDSRVKNAHNIFQRVLSTAGTTRLGVTPFLKVINKQTMEVFAIRGGGVILTTGALNKCYENTQHGDDRLAFILGHEIAHQMKDDFWHERFFHAIGLARIDIVGDIDAQASLNQVKEIASRTDDIMAKELEADGQGIIYASLAGYNPRTIIDEDEKVNFFVKWVKALDPTRVGIPKSDTHPAPKDRATYVKVQLKNILKEVDIYELGVMFYIEGEFELASKAFDRFLPFYPGREVYLNLAASHHQIALKNLQFLDTRKNKMLFQLSINLDPNLRFMEHWRRDENPETAFHLHLNKAIEYYREAISNDHSYIPAHINLASALIINDDAYGAVSELNNLIKQNIQTPEILSNLGVAYYYSEQEKHAKEKLLRAYQLDNLHNATLFNLGQLSKMEGDLAEAKKYWAEYLSISPHSSWSNIIPKDLAQPKFTKSTNDASSQESLTETIADIKIGGEDDKINSSQIKSQRNITLGKQTYVYRNHHNGVTSVSDLAIKKVIFLLTTNEYKGRSQQGVKIGDTTEKVKSSYGSPSNIIDFTYGQIWIYSNIGIAFRFNNAVISSWTLFDNKNPT